MTAHPRQDEQRDQADTAVRAVLAASNRYRTVTAIARESGLIPARVRRSLGRLDAARELRTNLSTFPFAYALKNPGGLA